MTESLNIETKLENSSGASSSGTNFESSSGSEPLGSPKGELCRRQTFEILPFVSNLDNTNDESPFLDDTKGLSRKSHKQVRAKCQFAVTDKCRGVVTQEYRSIKDVMDRNNNKYICLYCSRNMKYLGRNNPNCKYKTLDDNYFEKIDTEAKAYLLGWIASDGHVNGNNYIIIERDEDILIKLRNSVCQELPITKRNNSSMNAVGLRLSSSKMVKDVCNWLKINPGYKSDTVQFPELDTDDLKWAFIRGLFDGDGTIKKLTCKLPSRGCSIASSSDYMKYQIGKFCNIKHYINNKDIGFTGVSAVDFLSKIYSTSNENLRLIRKYNLYLEYLNYKPGLPFQGRRISNCKYIKTDLNAVAPSKTNTSDEGYDICLIGVNKKISDDTIRYETGIKFQPDDGWYIEILPISSLSNSGYILENNISSINESYKGTLKIDLTKINKNAEEIKFPFKAVQIVLRKSIHFIDDTAQNEKNFESTTDTK